MIREIQIRKLLPEAFVDDASSAADGSEVWLADSLVFERGRTYRVNAESGKGKSSLCSFIMGNRADYRGEILFDGVDVSGFDPKKWCDLRRTSLSWVAQQLDLFGELTVWENIQLKNRLTGLRDDSWIAKALQSLEIDDKRNTKARLISLGQQQRVAIVRALCQPFDFLLLDEPVSHLDSRRAAIAANLIRATAEEFGAAVIVTSLGVDMPLLDAVELHI